MSLKPRALLVLDVMSDRIGQMNSCRFDVQIALDSLDSDLGPLRYFNVCEVAYSGADRFYVRAEGQNGRRGLWYNGLDMAYYDFDHGLYGLIPAPEGHSIEAIQYVNETYGIDFPAADFLFPTFTDDLIEAHDRIEYLGLVNIGGTRCHHIVAKAENRSVQLWIEESGAMLPFKMVIFERRKNRMFSYASEFSNWEINPGLPDGLFDFPAPTDARPLKIAAKKNKK
jgi:hypothetical protein